MAAAGVHEAVELAARTAYGRLLAWLVSRSRDVATAEDALADALHAALRTWPERGIPERPEAWLAGHTGLAAFPDRPKSRFAAGFTSWRRIPAFLHRALEG